MSCWKHVFLANRLLWVWLPKAYRYILSCICGSCSSFPPKPRMYSLAAVRKCFLLHGASEYRSLSSICPLLGEAARQLPLLSLCWTEGWAACQFFSCLFFGETEFCLFLHQHSFVLPNPPNVCATDGTIHRCIFSGGLGEQEGWNPMLPSHSTCLEKLLMGWSKTSAQGGSSSFCSKGWWKVRIVNMTHRRRCWLPMSVSSMMQTQWG